MNQDFFNALQKMVAETWPGCIAFEVVIRLNTGRGHADAVLPVLPTPEFKLSVISSDAFVPSAVQVAILKALDGKAMRTDALESLVGGRSQLFRKPAGGIQELRDIGKVEHDSRFGYFRPDKPPPALQVND